MCYALDVATPLTLSEVRAMLPAGLAADSLTRADAAALLDLHPDAVTVVRLRRGTCACDFVLDRGAGAGGTGGAGGDDERHLRTRHFAEGRSREEVIAMLESHRRGAAHRPHPRHHWTRALATFVAEHARNAGPTLYYLHLGSGAPEPPADVRATRTVAQVVGAPDEWLAAEVPTLVVR